MFNVSALLLDDTSKSATPLTSGTINKTLWQFSPLTYTLIYWFAPLSGNGFL